MRPETMTRAQSGSVSASAAAPVGEPWLLTGLCAFAALRIFVWCAVFPFFTNIDEPAHFDLVLRYARAQFPHGLEMTSPEAAKFCAIYGSPEYLKTLADFPDGLMPTPPWKRPLEDVSAQLRSEVEGWKQIVNHEASQPPLYYTLAALWWHVGEFFGLRALPELYWLRFLNVGLGVVLVILGWAAGKLIFPSDFRLRLGFPMLLAFLPQDAFYSIQNDSLSAVILAAAFVLVLKFAKEDAPEISLGILTGALLAAGYLTKLSNVPMLAALVGFLLWVGVKKRTWKLPSTWCVVAAAALPVVAWMLWSKHAFGDFTGSNAKVRFLGWTNNPLSAWWHHPLLTPAGLWFFLSGVFSSLWRGELCWHLETLAAAPMDIFYTVSSLGLVAAALLSVRSSPVAKDKATQLNLPRTAVWLALSCVALSVLFLAWLSVTFDFGDCFYPSRAKPFLISGRLISGALLPLAVLYVLGLDWVLLRLRMRHTLLFWLGGLGFAVTLSELLLNAPVFASAYNWFH